MKKSLIFISTLALILVGCSSNSHDKDYDHHHDDAHEHADGMYKEHVHKDMMKEEQDKKEMMIAEEEMVVITSATTEDKMMEEKEMMNEAMSEKVDNHIHVVVEEGDTLSEIVLEHLVDHDGHSLEALVNKVADKNNIKNPDLIFPGQTVDLSM